MHRTFTIAQYGRVEIQRALPRLLMEALVLSIDAAMRYLFTPALMSSGPVSAWAAVKFRFQLGRGT